jgi:hypothetical protein
MVAQLAERARPLVDERPAGGDERGLVHAVESLPELGALDSVQDRLHQRTEPPRVAGRDQVDRAAHQRHADDGAIDQPIGELIRAESLEAIPQPDVGRVRRLRLEPDEVLDEPRGRHRRPAQEVLPVERRAVQRPEPDRRCGMHGAHPASRRSQARDGGHGTHPRRLV